MQRRHSLYSALVTIPLLLLFSLAGCSLNNGSGTGADATPTAGTACPEQYIGTVQSKSATSFTLATQQSGTLTVTYKSDDLAAQQLAATSGDLKTGAMIRVAVQQDANKQYTALIVVVIDALPSSPTGGNPGGLGMNGSNSGSGGNPGDSSSPGGTPPPLPNGNPGNSPGLGQNNQNCQVSPKDPTDGHLTITGSLGSVNGQTLTVDDTTNQPVASITLTSSTKFVRMTSAKASDIQQGMKVAVSASGSGGKYTSQLVTILLPDIAQ